MKISKLFHWLYAFLMLLPVLFVGVSSLYVVFNKNAKDSYYGETINESKYITINDLEELQEGVEYHTYPMSTQNDLSINRDNSSIDFYEFHYGNEVYYDSYFSFYHQINSTYLYLYVWKPDSSDYYINALNLEVNSFSFTFRKVKTINENIYDSFSSKFASVEYNKYSYLDNAFEYSMSKINDSYLFSWAKTSFLVVPMSYIGNLFGVPSSSPIITCLSYWLAISIIYLVFDLVMYVPLLVHRWIDKGIVE